MSKWQAWAVFGKSCRDYLYQFPSADKTWKEQNSFENPWEGVQWTPLEVFSNDSFVISYENILYFHLYSYHDRILYDHCLSVPLLKLYFGLWIVFLYFESYELTISKCWRFWRWKEIYNSIFSKLLIFYCFKLLFY